MVWSSNVSGDVQEEVALAVRGITKRHRIEHFCVGGHSYGTIWAGWVVKAMRNEVKQAVLLDPVCLLLCLPNTPFNFLYRPPSDSSHHRGCFLARIKQRLLDYGIYAVSRELTVANAMRRQFWWFQKILYAEDIHCPAIIGLASDDLLLSAPAIKKYITTRCPQAEIIWWQDFSHGEVLASTPKQFDLDHRIRAQEDKYYGTSRPPSWEGARSMRRRKSSKKAAAALHGGIKPLDVTRVGNDEMLSLPRRAVRTAENRLSKSKSQQGLRPPSSSTTSAEGVGKAGTSPATKKTSVSAAGKVLNSPTCSSPTVSTTTTTATTDGEAGGEKQIRRNPSDIPLTEEERPSTPQIEDESPTSSSPAPSPGPLETSKDSSSGGTSTSTKEPAASLFQTLWSSWWSLTLIGTHLSSRPQPQDQPEEENTVVDGKEQQSSTVPLSPSSVSSATSQLQAID